MKISTILIIILIISLPVLSLATPVNSSNARNVAQFFLEVKEKEDVFSINNLRTLNNSNGTSIGYVAELAPEGFIVTSNNTDIHPIISYSFRTNFSYRNIPQNTLLQMLRKDLTTRTNNLSTVGANLKNQNNELWQVYTNQNKIYFTQNKFQQWPELGTSPTDGLLNTTWTQNEPYNQFCPQDPQTGIRTTAGSVAISMAQIIYYFKYLPPTSFGVSDQYTTLSGINIDGDSDQYDFPDFDTINNKLKTISSKIRSGRRLTTENISLLNFACGISVNMHYSSSGEDSWTWDEANALRKKFNLEKSKKLYIDNPDFYPNLKKNIIAGLPAIMGFDDNYKHSAICDGFNSYGYYHLNLGWSVNPETAGMTTWYNLSLNINQTFVAHAIMDIREGVAEIQKQEIQKIELPDFAKDATIDLIEDEPEDTTEQAQKNQAIDDEIDEVMEETEAPQFGQTPKFVPYEESPVPIKQVPPNYPEFIKKMGIEGKVILSVEVLKSGKVGAVEVLKSLQEGENGLDESAIEAVKQWEFSPAKSGGKPIACWVNIPIEFSLE